MATKISKKLSIQIINEKTQLISRITHDILSKISSVNLLISAELYDDEESVQYLKESINEFVSHFKLLRSIISCDNIEKLQQLIPEIDINIQDNNIAFPIGLIILELYKIPNLKITQNNTQITIEGINLKKFDNYEAEDSILYFAKQMLENYQYEIV